MTTSTNLIRYGTKYTPSKKELLLPGPSNLSFAAVSLWGSNPSAVHESSTIKKFPSVTMIDSCMSNKAALLHWQRTMITQLGNEGFRKMCSDRARAGTRFHSKMEQILTKKPLEGIPGLDQIMNESEVAIHGYMQSVFNFLKSLPFTVNPMILEGRVTHHHLQYTGRFDAVLRFDDGPCLIDWKTASERSSVANNVSKGDGLKGLYGYPKQLAAYVGAFNSDPNYQHLDKVKRGMIVMAYDSGREAEVIDMSADELEDNWSHFVADVSGFWRAVQDGKTNFVYSE